MLSPQSRQLETSAISHNCCYSNLLLWFSGALVLEIHESSYFPSFEGTRAIEFNIKVSLFSLLLLLLPFFLQKPFPLLPVYLLGKSRGSKPVSKTSSLICNKSVTILPSDICWTSVKSAKVQKNTKKREMVMILNFAHNTI